MTGNSIRLGKILGVEVKIDYSWFLIFALLTWSLASMEYPSALRGLSSAEYWGMALATAVLFFSSVLAHELAHSRVSMANGVPVHDITLFVFGGAAQISEEPRRARDEFWMALVGPLMSLALAFTFGVLGFVLRASPPGLVAIWLMRVNLILAVFNLIPGFPLDGGRVFRSILWAWTRNLVLATRIATMVGQLVAYAFIFFGAYQALTGSLFNGLWIAFIGWFLNNAATASYRQLTLREMLKGHTVKEVMTVECAHVPPNLTLDVLVDQMVLPMGRRCFPVAVDGHVQGLVTIHSIKEVPRDRWKETRTQEAMIPWANLRSVGPEDALSDVLERMVAEDVNQFVVMVGDEWQGMIARDNLLAFIRTRSELGF